MLMHLVRPLSQGAGQDDWGWEVSACRAFQLGHWCGWARLERRQSADVEGIIVYEISVWSTSASGENSTDCH